MILTILSWFLLKKCNFDNTVLFLIRNQAFWTYCRAFWCLSVWPECSAGDLSLARPAQPGQASQASLARPGQPGRAQPGGLPAGQTRPRGSWEANFFFDSWKRKMGPTFFWQLNTKKWPHLFVDSWKTKLAQLVFQLSKKKLAARQLKFDVLASPALPARPKNAKWPFGPSGPARIGQLFFWQLNKKLGPTVFQLSKNKLGPTFFF